MQGFCSVAGSTNASLPDPEDPTCARLTVSGRFRKVDNATAATVQPKMFARHPQMSHWPVGHGWFFATIDISDLWLIDFYGGAALIPPKDYFAAPPPNASISPVLVEPGEIAKYREGKAGTAQLQAKRAHKQE